MTRRRGQHLLVNPIALATRRASKLPNHERAQILQPLQASCARLCEGIGAQPDWANLASACNVAMAIELQGVVRGLREHLHTTELTLQTVHRRAEDDAGRYPYALHLEEIEQLRTFLTVHAFQLGELSRGEYEKACSYAVDEVRASGGEVLQIRPMRQEALPL
jgi:hypothetical protein